MISQSNRKNVALVFGVASLGLLFGLMVGFVWNLIKPIEQISSILRNAQLAQVDAQDAAKQALGDGHPRTTLEPQDTLEITNIEIADTDRDNWSSSPAESETLQGSEVLDGNQGGNGGQEDGDTTEDIDFVVEDSPLARYNPNTVFRNPSEFDLNELPQGMRDYLQWHKAEIANPSKDTRYIIYACTGGCGGIGDRLRGIVSLFYYSILTRKLFGIRWEQPMPLHVALNISHVNWLEPIYRCPMRNSSSIYLLNADWGDFFNQLGLNRSRHALAKAESRMKRCTLVHSNAFFFYVQMWELGLPEALGLPPESNPNDYPLAAWALNLLFTTTARLEQEYRNFMTNLKIDPLEPYIAVHVRLGSKAETFFDPQRHRIKDLGNFEACANAMRQFVFHEMNAARNRNNVTMKSPPSSPSSIRIFLAADAMIAKRKLSETMENIAFMDEEAFHVDRSQGNPLSAQTAAWNRKTFAEFLFLARSRCLVASRSGFSYLPLFWSTDPKTNKRCWSWPTVDCRWSPDDGFLPVFANNKLTILPNNRLSDSYGRVF